MIRLMELTNSRESAGCILHFLQAEKSAAKLKLDGAALEVDFSLFGKTFALKSSSNL